MKVGRGLRYLTHALKTFPYHDTKLKLAVSLHVDLDWDTPQGTLELCERSDVVRDCSYVDELLANELEYGVGSLTFLVIFRFRKYEQGFESRVQEGEILAKTVFPRVARRKVLSVRMHPDGDVGEAMRSRDIEEFSA